LPFRLVGSVGIFLLETVGQFDTAVTSLEILPMHGSDFLYLDFQLILDGLRQGECPVFWTFAFPYVNSVESEVYIFDPQIQHFAHPQSAAIHEFDDQLIDAVEIVDDTPNLFTGQHDWDMLAFLGAKRLDIPITHVDTEHFSIEKQQSAECLILRRG